MARSALSTFDQDFVMALRFGHAISYFCCNFHIYSSGAIVALIVILVFLFLMGLYWHFVLGPQVANAFCERLFSNNYSRGQERANKIEEDAINGKVAAQFAVDKEKAEKLEQEMQAKRQKALEKAEKQRELQSKQEESLQLNRGRTILKRVDAIDTQV